VLKDIVDSERVNVAELQGLVNNFLQPLDTSNMYVVLHNKSCMYTCIPNIYLKFEIGT